MSEKESTFGEIKKAIIGVIVLAITTAGGVLINKFIGGSEEKSEPSVEQPQVVINLPEQKVEKDTVVKVVKVKTPVKKVEKEEAIDW